MKTKRVFLIVLDSFGVGERLITSKTEPVFGGVYKLAAIDRDGVMVPTMKVSDNAEKVTNPGDKELWRLYDKACGEAIADVITCADEVIDETKPYELFDPNHTWKRKTVDNFTARRLLQPVFLKGECVYENRDIDSIRTYCQAELATLWDSIKRFEKPQIYYVDLSKKLWDLRDTLLRQNMEAILD